MSMTSRIKPSMEASFDKDAVFSACEETLRSIEEARLRRMDMLVAPFLEYRRFWIFGPIRHRTKAEALARLSSFAPKLIDKYAADRTSAVRAILETAQANAGNRVYLSVDELEEIKAEYINYVTRAAEKSKADGVLKQS